MYRKPPYRLDISFLSDKNEGYFLKTLQTTFFLYFAFICTYPRVQKKRYEMKSLKRPRTQLTPLIIAWDENSYRD